MADNKLIRIIFMLIQLVFIGAVGAFLNIGAFFYFMISFHNILLSLLVSGFLSSLIGAYLMIVQLNFLKRKNGRRSKDNN